MPDPSPPIIPGDYPRILRICRSILYPPLSPEDTASTIYLFCLEHGAVPSHLLIHRKCYDEIRRFYKEKRALSGRSLTSPPESPLEAEDRLTFLMSASNLCPKEKDLIFTAFYLKTKIPRSDRGTLSRALQKLRATARALNGEL